MAKQPAICIVQPSVGRISETFITAHAERLPADVTVVHGLSHPQINGSVVLSQSFAQRGFRKVHRLLAGKGWNGEFTAGYLKAFRSAKAQAVLAEYGETGVRVLEACQRAGLPLIVHFHGYDASRHDVLQKREAEYRELFGKAAAIVAVSQAMRNRLIGMGAPEHIVHYNLYGVDCNRFRCTAPDRNPPTFLAVGRFVEKKAPHLTLLAFQRVLRDCVDARLRMIGEGVLLGPCRDLARALNIDHAVEFLGAQRHDVVAIEMQNARAFVQHSIEASDGDCEGTPVSVLEAGASGLPVVATRHAGIPDVVIDGETGLLVDERDVAGMSAHMLRLANDPDRAKLLGYAARERIETRITMERSISRLWEIIKSCIEGRTPQLDDAIGRQTL